MRHPALLSPLLLAPAATALDINIVYDTTIAGAVDCCDDGEACCDRVDDLLWHVGIASAFWSQIIEDDVTLTLRYCFADISAPDGNATDHDGSGRPIEGQIRIPYNWGFYWDSSPNDHSEFDMTPRLYRDMHPAEQGEAYDGPPPEFLEVAYNGFGPGNDALTVIMHEIGHVLGLNGNTHGCSGEHWFLADSEFLPSDGGWHPVWSVKGYAWANGNDCHHLAAGGIVECDDDPVCEAYQTLMWPGMLPGGRSLPSIVDIMAIKEAGNWNEIDLPRKYATHSGDWSDGDTWLGDKAPTASHDVYLVRSAALAVESWGVNAGGDVLVTLNNDLRVMTGTLDVGDVTLEDDAFLMVDIGAQLDAVNVRVAPDASMQVRTAAVADLWNLENNGELSGGGVVNTSLFENMGTIRASGGDLILNVSGACDLDGFGVNAAILATVGDVTIDASVPEPVLATVSIGPNRTVEFTQGWTQQNPSVYGHAIIFNGVGGGAALRGESVLHGDVEVSGTGRMYDRVEYHPTANVNLDTDAVLIHDGPVHYHGGAFTGANGTIAERGGVRVHADTTIGPISVYDFDGGGLDDAIVEAGAQFIVHADALESSGNDGYDATLSIDGECIMNIADTWQLEGEILMNLAGGTNGRLGGSRVEVLGTVTGRHTMHIDAPVRVMNGANLHTIEASTEMILSSDQTSELVDGAITGVGTVIVAPPAFLTGTGTIAPTLVVDGETRAGAGWLVLDVRPIVNAGGILGTRSADSVLFVAESWSNNDGLVHNDNGWIGGEAFTNRADTTGHGFMAMTQFTNKGRLAPGAPGGFVFDGSEGAGLLAFFEFAQTSAGTTELMIGGLVAGESDGLIVDGHASLDGRLALSLEPGFLPEIGDEIAIMTYSTRSGAFSSVIGTTLPGARAFEVVYADDHIDLVVVAGCGGDVDGSGDTGFEDILAVIANWGPCAPGPCPADLDGNGAVDFNDLLEVLANYGGCG